MPRRLLAVVLVVAGGASALDLLAAGVATSWSSTSWALRGTTVVLVVAVVRYRAVGATPRSASSARLA